MIARYRNRSLVSFGTSPTPTTLMPLPTTTTATATATQAETETVRPSGSSPRLKDALYQRALSSEAQMLCARSSKSKVCWMMLKLIISRKFAARARKAHISRPIFFVSFFFFSQSSGSPTDLSLLFWAPKHLCCAHNSAKPFGCARRAGPLERPRPRAE